MKIYPEEPIPMVSDRYRLLWSTYSPKNIPTFMSGSMSFMLIIILSLFLSGCSGKSEPLQVVDECQQDSDCRKGGCSGELCLTVEKAAHTSSVCMYREEYDCLEFSSCRCMQGKCGWEENEEYNSCLAGEER